MSEHQIVGKPLPRVDAREKVTGQAIYGADFRLPGMLVGRFLGSAYAHAEIRRIDTSRAEALPGVYAVVTAADLPRGEHYDAGSRAHAVFAGDRALFVGQPVAAVAAEDLATAQEALRLIEIEYNPLPAVLDPVQAMDPSSPVIQHEGPADRSEMDVHTQQAADVKTLEDNENDNVVNKVDFEQGDVARGFAEADVIVEHTYRVPMVHQGYVEPHSQTALWDSSGRVTIWISTQGIFDVRERLAETLGLSASQIRVISTEIGGGFGGKMALFAPLVAVLARKAKRPVQLVLSRHEELQASNPAPLSVVHLKTGVKRDGTITAIQGKAVVDTGAYSGAPMTVICIMLGQAYKCANVRIEGYEVLTNKPSVTAYRAPGGPNAAFSIESQVDEMARAIGMDPLEFRLRNAAEEGTMQPHGRAHRRIGLKETLAALRPAWEDAKRWKQEPGDQWRGIGVACGGWEGGRGPGVAFMVLDEDGMFRLVCGVVDLTGSHTSLAQIAAEALGVSPARVRVVKSDTDTGPWAPMSAGSQTTYGMGPAVQEAAADARRQLLRYAAAYLKTRAGKLTLADDQIYVTDKPEKHVTLKKMYDLANGWSARFKPILGRGTAPRRQPAPSFAACVAAVEVDPETGKASIRRLVAAQDVGQAINPLSVEGQIQGGTVQSVGIALWEELAFDEQGTVRNPNLLDYRKATAADLPFIQTVLVNVPAGDGAYGAKIVGEPSIVPPVGAVANAVADAIGARVYDLPIMPERVWRALAARG